MEELFSSLGNWTWWIVAAVLFVLELMMPGVFFLWLGLSAMVVGVIVLVVDIPWQGQIAAFAVLSIIALIVSRYFFAARKVVTDQPNLNKRMYNYVGQRFVLETPITNGTGSIRIDDTIWTVRGNDADVGAWIRITDVEGPNFLVEPADGGS